jgi:hypothetical protein
MKLARRGGSALDTADTVLAVVVGVIAVCAVLWVLSWVIGAFMFLIKAAIVVGIIAAVVSVVTTFKRD